MHHPCHLPSPCTLLPEVGTVWDHVQECNQSQLDALSKKLPSEHEEAYHGRNDRQARREGFPDDDLRHQVDR